MTFVWLFETRSHGREKMVQQSSGTTCGQGSTRSRSGMSRLSGLLIVHNISTSETEGCLTSSPRGRGCRIYSGEEVRWIRLTLSSWCPTS